MVSREILELLAYELQGTCTSLEALIENHNLNINSFELEDQLLDVNTEMCKGCNWWFESSDLIGEDDEAGYCDDCRKESF